MSSLTMVPSAMCSQKEHILKTAETISKLNTKGLSLQAKFLSSSSPKSNSRSSLRNEYSTVPYDDYSVATSPNANTTLMESACIRALKKSQDVIKNQAAENSQLMSSMKEQKTQFEITIQSLAAENKLLYEELYRLRKSLDVHVAENDNGLNCRAEFEKEVSELRERLHHAEIKKVAAETECSQWQRRMDAIVGNLQHKLRESERGYAKLSNQLHHTETTEAQLLQLFRPIVCEKKSLLKFVADLLNCVRELFLDPTILSIWNQRTSALPRSVKKIRQKGTSSFTLPGGGGGALSRTNGHMSFRSRYPATPVSLLIGNKLRYAPGRSSLRSTFSPNQSGHIGDVIESLEMEVHETAVEMQRIIEIASEEADKCCQVMTLYPNMPSASLLYKILCGIDRKIGPSQSGVFHDTEHIEKQQPTHDKNDLPEPNVINKEQESCFPSKETCTSPAWGTHVDWGKERKKFHALARLMATKRSQLTRLRKAVKTC